MSFILRSLIVIGLVFAYSPVREEWAREEVAQQAARTIADLIASHGAGIDLAAGGEAGLHAGGAARIGAGAGPSGQDMWQALSEPARQRLAIEIARQLSQQP